MATDWYYAQQNQQKGPVSGPDLLALEKAGLLLPGTLVWRTGLASWQPWASVAPDLHSEAGLEASPAGEVAVCAYSGRVLPVSQMVKYGDRYVGIEYKDAFVESLRQGGRVQAMSGSAELQPVGFWWRVLAMIVDVMVLMVPNMVLMAPYMYFSFQDAMHRVGKLPVNPVEQFSTMGSATIISYVAAMLGTFVVNMIYETWMVGKYEGTVGKRALGFKIVKADGDRPTYGRAFGRWGAKVLTNLIWVVPAYGAILLGFFTTVGAEKAGGIKAGVPTGLIVGVIIGMIWFVLGGFGYYMAGWTKRKQALHDKICATLVVRKTPL